MSASALRGRGSGAPPRARSVAPACVDAPTLDSQAPANQSPTPAHVAPGQLPNPLPELVLLNVCHRHWPALGGAVLADQTRVDSCELLFIKLTPGPQWQPAAERSSTSTRQAENTPGGQLAASPRARAAAGSFGRAAMGGTSWGFACPVLSISSLLSAGSGYIQRRLGRGAE